MRYIRKIYNMNKSGNYPAVSFPREMAAMLSDFVIMESCPDGILIRPAKIEPMHSG
jgi:hypothetical protein